MFEMFVKIIIMKTLLISLFFFSFALAQEEKFTTNCHFNIEEVDSTGTKKTSSELKTLSEAWG